MSPQTAPHPGARRCRQPEDDRDLRGSDLDPVQYRSDDLTLRSPVRFLQLRLQPRAEHPQKAMSSRGLEIYLYSELHFSRQPLERIGRPSGCNRSGPGYPDSRKRVIELWRIGQVECFDPELQGARRIFFEKEAFEDRKVKLGGARAGQGVAANIAELQGRGCRECRDIKPLIKTPPWGQQPAVANACV